MTPLATPSTNDQPISDQHIHECAVSLGRKGGQKGGKARAAKLTKEQRVAAAVKAAKARWDKPKLLTLAQIREQLEIIRSGAAKASNTCSAMLDSLAKSLQHLSRVSTSWCAGFTHGYNGNQPFPGDDNKYHAGYDEGKVLKKLLDKSRLKD